MNFAKIQFFILLGLILPEAGVVISSRILGADVKTAPTSTQMTRVEKDKLCVTIQSNNKETRIIYRKDKDAVYMVDVSAKSYTEMTRADVKKAGDRMQEAREKMQEAMKNMPPEQRAMMEKMMGGIVPSAPPVASKMEYKKTGSSKSGNWKTDEYDGFRDGSKSSHLWIVDYGKLGVSREDFAVLKELGDFFSSLKISSPMDFMKETETLPGFPVRSQTFGENGKESVTMEVTEFKKEEIPPSHFDIPDQYTRKKLDIPELNGGKRPKGGGSRD